MGRKLALYSDQIPPSTDPVDARILDWMPPNGGRVGYIPSAPDSSRTWFRAHQEYYQRYELELLYFGLEEEYEEDRWAELLACNAIHLTGGNTFQFLHWLRRRSLIAPLQRYVQGGGVLIGVSAGAILMTPDISTSLLCGDRLYAGKEDTTGLSLVDFAFAPHYDGTHAGRRELLEYSTTFEGDVYAVTDGGAVIVDDDQTEFFGSILVARKGVIVSE